LVLPVGEGAVCRCGALVALPHGGIWLLGRSGRLVELVPLHGSARVAAASAVDACPKASKSGIAESDACGVASNVTLACWTRHAGPTGMMVQQVWGSHDGSVLVLDGHGTLYQRTWSDDLLWWVPHTKPGFPMRPTWGNAGLSIGTWDLSQHQESIIESSHAGRLLLVGLDGKLYERGYSAQGWMHPDRFSWADLGQPPASPSGIGGAAGEFGDGTVKLVDILDAHRLRQGSILVLSWNGHVWELIKARKKWKDRGAPPGERVAHAGSSVYLGPTRSLRSLFVLTVGGKLAELACAAKSIKQGKFLDCEWVLHGTPAGVAIAGGLLALGNQGSVLCVATDGRVHERKQVRTQNFIGHSSPLLLACRPERETKQQRWYGARSKLHKMRETSNGSGICSAHLEEPRRGSPRPGALLATRLLPCTLLTMGSRKPLSASQRWQSCATHLLPRGRFSVPCRLKGSRRTETVTRQTLNHCL
jgi:hypothetical protein